jgi:hypothetical protein
MMYPRRTGRIARRAVGVAVTVAAGGTGPAC